MLELRPFQRRFLRRALAPGIRTSGFCLARGEGKSALAAYILERCLTPGDSLFQPGAEYLLCTASLEQARNSFRPIRTALEPTGEYRFIDSVMRLGITHKPTNTKLRVMSSNCKDGVWDSRNAAAGSRRTGRMGDGRRGADARRDTDGSREAGEPFTGDLHWHTCAVNVWLVA